MFTAIKFFISHLNIYQLGALGLFLYIHIGSHFWHLNSEKELTKRIVVILANSNDELFYDELIEILARNVFYLLLYAITMAIVESIGKLALRNAVNGIVNKMLYIDLQTIQKKDYEHKITSIVHHADNISTAVHNLFVEFPRKAVTTVHFLIALQELSMELMLYCIIANLLFTVITVFITFIRKHLISRVLEGNINFSIICSDLSNSIQTYKIDDRIKEYQDKIIKINQKNYLYSSLDSLMVATVDAIGGFSSQFMVGLISFACRPMVLNKIIPIADIMYGIRASGKFIEKMVNVIEYFGDVIRQYKSFAFFNTSDIRSEKRTKFDREIKSITIDNSDNTRITKTFGTKKGALIRLIGKNGVGKTTALYKFLGVNYQGSTTNGSITAHGYEDILIPQMFHKKIAFVQQIIPITNDTVAEYITASGKTDYKRINNVLVHFDLNEKTNEYICKFLEEVGWNKRVKELSGGQGKMLQIISALCKLYTNGGEILVLDEPTNNLDIEKISYLKEILKKCTEHGITILIVTHDEQLLNIEHEVIEFV